MGPKRLKTLLPLHHAGRSNIHQNQKRGPYGSVSSSAISSSLLNTSFNSIPGTTATPQIARPKRPYTRRHTGSTSSTNINGSGDQNIMAKIALVESQLNKRVDDLTSRQEVLEILYGSLEREMDGLTDLTKFVLNCVNSLFHGFIQVQQQLNFQHFFASQQQSSSSSGNNGNVNNFEGHEGEGRPGLVPVSGPMFMMPIPMSSAPFPVPLTTSVTPTDATKHGSIAGSSVGSPSPSASPSSSSSVLHLNTNQKVENGSQIQLEVSDEESVLNYCQNDIRDKTEGGENENVEDIEIEEKEDDGKTQQPPQVDVDMDTINAHIPKLNQIKRKRKQLYTFQSHKEVKAERPLMEVIQEYYELETSEENSNSSSSSSVVVSATSVEILEANNGTGTGTGDGHRAAADCGDIISGDIIEGQGGQGRGQLATAAMGTELRPESTSILGERLSSYELQHVCEFCLNGFRHKRNLMKHQIIIPMYCRRKRAKMAKSTMPTLLRRSMIKGRNVIYQRGNIVNIPPVLRINDNDNDNGENDDGNERNNNSSSISNAVNISENDEENIAINSSRLSELGLGINSDVGDKVRLQFGS